MVTRNDVARAAGVSSAVVSYVLNDGPRGVSAGARERVLAAIDELGYRRNSVARSMRTRKTNSIGFVLPEIAVSYFSVMTHRIAEIARSRGLSLIVATSNGDIDVEREHLVELAGRQVDGIILMSVDPSRDLSWTGDLGMPVLLVDRPQVAAEASEAATRHLLDHGCRRIARLTSLPGELFTRRRDIGWERALRAGGVDPATAVVAHAATSAAAGYTASRALLSGPEIPDGVVLDHPAHASAFLRAAADLDVAVPGDVAVVATEVGDSAEYSVPRLTSVDSPLDEIAERAVDTITASPSGARLLFLDGADFTLTERESCGHSRSTD